MEKKESIRTVINKNGKLYRYITNNIRHNEHHQIILPKLITGEQFYSAGYANRIADIDWDSLPYLDVNESDIIIN